MRRSHEKSPGSAVSSKRSICSCISTGPNVLIFQAYEAEKAKGGARYAGRRRLRHHAAAGIRGLQAQAQALNTGRLLQCLKLSQNLVLKISGRQLRFGMIRSFLSEARQRTRAAGGRRGGRPRPGGEDHQAPAQADGPGGGPLRPPLLLRCSVVHGHFSVGTINLFR